MFTAASAKRMGGELAAARVAMPVTSATRRRGTWLCAAWSYADACTTNAAFAIHVHGQRPEEAPS